VATAKQQYLEALDNLEGKIKRELLDAIRESMKRVDVKELRAAIVAGDMEKIISTAGLSRGDLAIVTEALRQGYVDAAAGQALAFNVAFDVALPNIQAALAMRSSEFVVELTGEDQRQAIRDTVAAGYDAGRNPNDIARDLVGRVGASGYREGGVVGLTNQQAGYVNRMRAEIGALDRHYFTRQRRDKRFDAAVRKAIKSGKPLTPQQIDRITGRYADRLKALRGETIARTEALREINAGRYDAIAQSMEETGVTDVTLVWSATMDVKTRDLHRLLHGESRAFGVPFKDADGNQMRYPGDFSLDARPETLINCRCFLETHVNFAQKVA
jgi:hypothetical protein